MENTSEQINRKSLLYRTGVEYSDFTLNHVLGCSHGCKYPCYAFLMAKRFGKINTYEEWVNPKIVANALELLKKEIPKYKNKINSVHLCFTTDPFMNGNENVIDMSIELITTLNNSNITCTVLTKGLLPKELTKLSPNNQYGITLISLNEDLRKQIEPGASAYKDRISKLKYLHDKGYKTWVSIEPYPTPNIIKQNFSNILEEIKFVDKIIFGRTNYNAKISEFKSSKEFYNELSHRVIDFCINNDIDYHIKKGTLTNI